MKAFVLTALSNVLGLAGSLVEAVWGKLLDARPTQSKCSCDSCTFITVSPASPADSSVRTPNIQDDDLATSCES